MRSYAFRRDPKWFHKCRCAGHAESGINKPAVEFAFALEEDAQTPQHLILRNFQAPLQHDLLRTVKKALLNDRGKHPYLAVPIYLPGS